MALGFLKMHGLGNDFVVIDGRPDRAGGAAAAALLGDAATAAALARALGDRHFGVGFDQMVSVLPSETADARIVFHNPDGGVAGACGNATRCVARLLMQESGADAAVIETVAGLLPVRCAGGGLIEADMGAPRLDAAEIPLADASLDSAALDHWPQFGLGPATAVSMGNPHAVFFTTGVEAAPLETVGAAVERDPLFPERANVELVEPLGRDAARLRVWERGAGVTLACGSGACAAVVAGVRRGLLDRRVALALDGGQLLIEWRDSDGHVVMTGPASQVFSGVLDAAFLDAALAGAREEGGA